MVKVAEGFETGKNKLIHYSGMFLLQTEHNVYTSTDCKEWKTTLTTNKKFNNAKYVNDKFAICGDEGVKFLSIEKSLKEQVNELNSALDTLKPSTIGCYTGSGTVSTPLIAGTWNTWIDAPAIGKTPLAVIAAWSNTNVVLQLRYQSGSIQILPQAAVNNITIQYAILYFN